MKVDSFVPLSNFIAPAYTVFRQLQDVLLEAKVCIIFMFKIKSINQKFLIKTFKQMIIT